MPSGMMPRKEIVASLEDGVGGGVEDGVEDGVGDGVGVLKTMLDVVPSRVAATVGKSVLCGEGEGDGSSVDVSQSVTCV